MCAIRLNSNPRDAVGKGLAENFGLVKDCLSCIIHLHNLNDKRYPYELLVNLLVKAGWTGWALLEIQDPFPPDRVAALAAQRERWEAMVANARRAQATS